MGRNKVLGDYECPKCGRLSRLRTKKVRGKKTSRYIEHQYFRHNDDGTEHYINNATKQLWHDGSDDHLDAVNSILNHRFNRIHATVNEYNLPEDERRQWLMASIKYMQDVVMPFTRIVTILKMKRLSGLMREPLPQEIADEFEEMSKWIRSGGLRKAVDAVVADHPYRDQLLYMNKNYESKRRREIIKKRVGKWEEHYNNPPRTFADPKDLVTTSAKERV